MLTIGQLARHAGVSIKTIRVYHDEGLLSEPERDTSGYRRYTAQHVIEHRHGVNAEPEHRRIRTMLLR